jgi:hypothetical protein
MILRSLTKHVKDQNWFAVGLDFAIVVIGVFIGIQVANWNELQAERGQTERMLSDLIVDLEEMREHAAYQSDDYLKLATLTDDLLDALEAGEALWSDPKARVALTRLYSFHGNMRALSQITERAIDDVLDAVPEGAITSGQ